MLDAEQPTAFLAEIEAQLNSRSLTCLSADSRDYSVITSAKILIWKIFKRLKQKIPVLPNTLVEPSLNVFIIIRDLQVVFWSVGMPSIWSLWHLSRNDLRLGARYIKIPYPVYYLATRIWKSYSSPSRCSDAELAAERDWTCWRHCLTLCWCTPCIGREYVPKCWNYGHASSHPWVKDTIFRNTYNARACLFKVMLCFVSLLLLLLFCWFIFFLYCGKRGWCCLPEEFFCTFPLFYYSKEQSLGLSFFRPWWLYCFSQWR